MNEKIVELLEGILGELRILNGRAGAAAAENQGRSAKADAMMDALKANLPENLREAFGGLINGQ